MTHDELEMLAREADALQTIADNAAQGVRAAARTFWNIREGDIVAASSDGRLWCVVSLHFPMGTHRPMVAEAVRVRPDGSRAIGKRTTWLGDAWEHVS
jgi:hypothetical protein